MIYEIKCSKCKSHFIFKPCTPVGVTTDERLPLFCPYCGRIAPATGLDTSERNTKFTIGERHDLVYK